MDIYMIPLELVSLDYKEDLNGFLPSDWNELEKLPKEVLNYIEYCKKSDLVYTSYNFMLDFNLEQKTTKPSDYLMFIPDPKFKI
mgnify:CR=1 FL=1